MEEALVLIEEHQIWFYLSLGIIGLLYLRLVIVHLREFRSTFFGLERDRAREKLIRSSVMLSLVAIGLVAIFVAATFGGPAVPVNARPTVLPTVSLLSTPEVILSEENVGATSTPLGEGGFEELGCSNPKATITFPQDGDSINGVVEILGVANIPGFAFYKVEIKVLSPDALWQAVGANTDPVCEICAEQEVLARWDTSLVATGDFVIRLMVMDTAGNAPLPCEVNVRVLPSE
jgi:hypothetical protein